MAVDKNNPRPTLLAFTGPQIERLTGLSRRQLTYWEQTGVYSASYIDDRPYRPYKRIYSFRDLVSLRALALLRNKHNVRLDALRSAGRYLSDYVDSPWSELQFRVGPNHEVIFRDPRSGEWITSDPLGQRVIATILLDDIRNEVERDSAALLERNPADIGQISRHRHVAHNQWVVRGTRVTTDTIWDFHEAGYTPEQIQVEYPHITIADVISAIQHEESIRGAA